MLLEFYDIPVKLHGKKIHLIEEPKCIYSMSFPEAIDMDEFEEKFNDALMNDIRIDENFDLDKMYFIIEGHENPYGVISLHKGYTFIDCPEHNERVIMKCGFPEMKCYIEGEE